MLEQELKLSVEGDFAPTFPPGRSDVAGVDELPALDLHATYAGIERTEEPGYRARPGHEALPVTQVSWLGARLYCASGISRSTSFAIA